VLVDGLGRIEQFAAKGPSPGVPGLGLQPFSTPLHSHLRHLQIALWENSAQSQVSEVQVKDGNLSPVAVEAFVLRGTTTASTPWTLPTHTRSRSPL